jgi:hypothetical protein
MPPPNVRYCPCPEMSGFVRLNGDAKRSQIGVHDRSQSFVLSNIEIVGPIVTLETKPTYN